MSAMAGELEGGVEPAIAAADDRDVGRGRRITRRFLARTPGLPPVGQRLEFGMKNPPFGVHPRSPSPPSTCLQLTPPQPPAEHHQHPYLNFLQTRSCSTL